jgi:hypothetical protein
VGHPRHSVSGGGGGGGASTVVVIMVGWGAPLLFG